MRIERELVIAAPRDRVWEIVANLADHAHLLTGVTRWKPLEGGRELRSRHDVRLQVGAAQLGSVIEISEMTEACDLAWVSISGIDHRGRFTLRDADVAGHTRLRFRLTYTAPGGIVGLVAGRMARPLLQRSVDSTVDAIKRRAEQTAELVLRTPSDDGGLLPRAMAAVVDATETVVVLRRAGLLRSRSPLAMVNTVRSFQRYGLTIPTAVAAAAVDTPERIAIVDEAGTESYAELEERSDALACGLLDAGIEPGASIAVQCRNHRLFVESIVALAKIGANALLLNTSFSGPQVADVLEREGVIALIADADMEPPDTEAVLGTNRFVAWRDEGPATGMRSVTALVESGLGRRPPPPSQPGRQTILTSGTTGKPKGARRGATTGLDPLVAFLSRVPLRAGETTVIAPPLFHAWGFAHLTLGLLLGSTMVVRRRFDAAATLSDVAAHGATTMVVVPVMLQRMLDLPKSERSVDTSTLRAVAVSGSALPGALATEFMDAYGDVLYNLYGSTEVAWAAIATPPDLRLVPGAAGRPPRGTIVKLLDDNGVEVVPGETGRIFVGSSLGFEGYTDGDDKNRLGGLISVGDLGHWDWSGQLIVEGREDDMIVSGGENVFPQEVEDLLAAHDKIADVAVVGVPDEKFGGALEAWVVKAGKAALSEDEVRTYVKSNLASYKVPRAVRFIDELPRNATGKVLKRELQPSDS